MKTLLKAIGIAISTILILLVAIVITIGVMIHDTNDNSNGDIIQNPRETQELLNEYLVDAFKDSKEDERVDLLLSEYEVSYILDSIKTIINVPFLNVKSIYAIYNSDGSVTVEGPISFFGFKSVIRGSLDIKLEGDGSFIVTISNIGAGKLDVSSKVLRALALNKKSIEKTEENLKENGIFVKLSVDDTKLKIEATKEEINKTIDSLLKTDEKYLYTAIVNEILGKDELLKLYFNDESKIGVQVFLNELKNTISLDCDIENDSLNMGMVKENALILLKEGVMDYKNSSVVIDFLVRGYEPLNDSEKEIVDSLDLSSIGINKANTYKGIIYKSSLTMAKIFLDASIQDPLKWGEYLIRGYYDITINEKNLNELFNSLSFIGTSFSFASKDDLAYITISNLITDMSDETLDAYMVLDVNGYYAMAKVHAIVLSNEDSMLTLKIESVSLGENDIESSSKDSLLKYLSSVLKEEKFIGIDADNSTMSLDFSSYIEGSFFEFLINGGLSRISIHLSNDNNGELVLRFSK